MIRSCLIFATAAVLLCACNALDDAEYSEIKDFASPEHEITVPASGGEAVFTVYCNAPVEAKVLGSLPEGVSAGPLSFSKDTKITVSFGENNSFRRSVVLALSFDGGARTDTLRALQEGLKAELSCSSPYSTVSGSSAGSVSFAVDTNLPSGEIATETEYLFGGEGWISSVESSEGSVSVKTAAAQSNHISKAIVWLHHTDGWGNELRLPLVLTRSGLNGEFGTRKTFAEATAYEGTVEEDILIEGVIVSDFRSKNVAFNPAVNYDEVDTSENERTAYLQASDASMGFRLKFASASDNVLAFGTGLSLSLQGAALRKLDALEAWEISGLSAANMVQSTEGAVVAEKRKSIASLEDSDLFTYIEIPNTEFVYKKGCYANVYENYALRSEVNAVLKLGNGRFDCWASLLVDSEGSAIYAPVNMLCTWRRSGNGVPQGNGSVRGVLVNENNPRYGDMGRYQIRVLDEDGFAQERSGASAYTEWAEWDGSPHHYRYAVLGGFNSKYADPGSAAARLGTITPSDDISASKPTPNAELSYENKTVGASAGVYPVSSWHSFTSPIVTASGIGDRGIASYDNSDTNPKSLCLNNEIKGWYKWDGNEISGYNGVLLSTSTKELSGSVMYLSFAFSVGKISAGTSQYFPAHWCVEYSTDGGESFTLCPSAVTGGDYVHLHTLPWYDALIDGLKYYTSSRCGLGATAHLCKLPEDAFGKESLLVRIRPYDDVMSVFPLQWDAETETATVRHNTNANTIITFEHISLCYR